MLIETGPIAGPEPDRALVRLNFVALVTALDALASGRVEAADPARYESAARERLAAAAHARHRRHHRQRRGRRAFVGDIGISAARVVATRDGTRTVRLNGRIADLGDLRVYGALETIDATGLTAVPLLEPAPRAAMRCASPTGGPGGDRPSAVGQPGALLLLAPVPGRDGLWRVVRVVGV